jgi:dihydrofolate synthase/folylpolyglutamate synthase
VKRWLRPWRPGAAARVGGAPHIQAHEGPVQALAAAAARASAADRIVVFGSFYTVGGVLKNGLPRLSAPHVG